MIRRIDQALVNASTREEIERAVCRELARDGPYQFAWIGEFDAIDETVRPREFAGEHREYLDSISLSIEENSQRDWPVVTAVKRQQPEQLQDLMGDPPIAPWRQAALNRGTRSLIALPLVYRGSKYGVLTVHATDPDVFDELEHSVLVELSEAIAYALNALESRRALVSDRVVELEFEVCGPEVALLGLTGESDGRMEFQNLVLDPDGLPRALFRIEGVDPESIHRFVEMSTAITDARIIADQEAFVLLECTLSETSLIGTLLVHQAVPRSFTAVGDTATVVVDLPHDRGVREFSEMLETQYPGAELRARRERDRSLRSRQGFKTAFEDRLTDRQQEVLRTAYFAGYFETPRESTGQDIGESLNISQPTVNHHIRASQRKFLEMLYGERTPGDDRSR